MSQAIISLLKVLTYSIVLLFLLLLMSVFILTDQQSIIESKSHQQIEQADSLDSLMQQIVYARRFAMYKQQIQLNHAQVNAIAGLAQRAIPSISAQAQIDSTHNHFALSYELPAITGGRFVNLRVELQSAKKLQLRNVEIGSLNIDGDVALDLVLWTFDRVIGSDLASQFNERIVGVHIVDDAMKITLLPFNDLLVQAKKIKRPLDEEEIAFQADVIFYLKTLNNLSSSLPVPARSAVSAEKFIIPLFKTVSERSSSTTAIAQNKAAIIALASFSGSRHFGRLVGNIDPLWLAKNQAKQQLVLANRRDLYLHFIFSAAIEVLSQKGISIAIGEFKELIDRGDNGSGFSFADLAADITGITLAQQATSEQASAVSGRLALAETEADFFPSIVDLPEGLHKTDFGEQIGEVDSPVYQQYRETIRQRIDQLPVFNDQP